MIVKPLVQPQKKYFFFAQSAFHEIFFLILQLFLFFFLFLFLFSSCTDKADTSVQAPMEQHSHRVLVFVPIELENLWKRATSLYPLSQEFEWDIRYTREENRKTEERSFFDTTHIIISLHPYRPWAENIPPDGVLIKKQAFLPITHLSDPRQSISLDEVEEFSLSVPKEVLLPEKALRIEGKQIDHPEYPLVEETYFSWEIIGPPPADEGNSTEVDRKKKEQNKKVIQLFTQWIDQVKPSFFEDTISPVFRIALVGDIMPGRGTDSILLSEGGIKKVFGSTLELLREHHYAAGNLETVVTTGGVPFPKSYTFRVYPAVLGKLKEAGFHYFSITNNHCWDFYEEGFLDTLKYLDIENIGYSGAGETLADAKASWTTGMEKNGELKILSIGAYPKEQNGFSGVKEAKADSEKPGILWADEDGFQAITTIADNKKPGDFLLVMVHGGHEWRNKPGPEERDTYRRFIDLGADAVIGSHPHVLQGAEVYRGKLIAYSLGNFIFPGMDETKYGEESLILSLGIWGGEILYCDFFPVRIEGRTIDLDESGIILERFTRLINDLQ